MIILKKLITILLTITLVITLSACNQNKYEGQIYYFEDSQISSYTMTISYFGNTVIQYENNKLHTNLDDTNYYAYLQDNQYIEVNYDTTGTAYGIIVDEEADFVIFENLFEQMDLEAPFNDYTQDGTTNRFYYEDGQGLFEIWLNDDNYIIDFKVSNSQTNEVTFHIYDINTTSVEIPSHDVYQPYEYVLNVYYDQFKDLFTEDGDYLFFDDATFTIKVKTDGSQVLYLDQDGNVWEYQLNGLIGFENEAGVHYTLNEFSNLYPTFDEDYLDQILAAAYAMSDPASLFPNE